MNMKKSGKKLLKFYIFLHYCLDNSKIYTTFVPKLSKK